MCCVAALPLLHGGHACAGLRWHDAQPPRRRRIQICTRWEQRYAGDLQARARARRVLAHSNKRQRTRRAVGERSGRTHHVHLGAKQSREAAEDRATGGLGASAWKYASVLHAARRNNTHAHTEAA